MKRLPDGQKNRKNPDKPANRRGGCDPCESGVPWCKGCEGTHEDTFNCRSRALKYMASLSDKERKRMMEKYGDCMYPILYR